MSKIRSGRLRHYVMFMARGGTNEYGETESDTLVFDCRCEVQVKSGNKMVEYNAELTNSIITILTYYNELVDNSQIVVWEGLEYEVSHVAKDTVDQSMIVTAERVSR